MKPLYEQSQAWNILHDTKAASALPRSTSNRLLREIACDNFATSFGEFRGYFHDNLLKIKT
jgi:hypothetical protein